MNEIYNQYKEDMEFFFVYVREAHPTDGWQVDANVEEGILFRQHQSIEERDGVVTYHGGGRPTLLGLGRLFGSYQVHHQLKM